MYKTSLKKVKFELNQQKKMIKTLGQISFSNHLMIAFFIRIALIIYSEIHDERTSDVSYTDIDYKVVTDGARYIIEHQSPYKRHTFRYSPLLAILLIPNILFFDCFGKVLFSIFDVFVGYLIKLIVYNELKSIFYENAEAFNLAYQKNFVNKHKTINFTRSEVRKKLHMPDRYINWSTWSSLVWLYNPLAMVISTRGNGDSFSSIFVLLTLYYLQKFEMNNSDIILAGIFHGLSIHLRIYPVIFSLAYFFNLSNYKFIDVKNIRYKLFIPNYRQFLLISGTIVGFTFFSGLFIHLYGWPFVYETYIYHFKRRDIRHNFSLYFLMQYLTPNTDNQIESVTKNDETLLVAGFEKAFITMPQLAIFIYLSCTFGINRKTLSFCVFLQTFVMVTYNTVVTSQYFVWYLALLPICVKNLRNMPIKLALLYFSLWLLAQALWLLPAYLLEFKTMNTFNFIGIQGVAFFFVNIFMIQRFVKYFDVFSKIR